MKNIINTQNIEQPIYSKQIIHFFSVKDGVGKTTTSLNTAIELAKNTSKKICIIDLNTTNANIHSHLGLFDATNDLSKLTMSLDSIDGNVLSKLATKYKTKDKNRNTIDIDVFIGFRGMITPNNLSNSMVERILSILEELYDIVIVDSNSSPMNDITACILKKSTKIIYIIEQEITVLNGAKEFLTAVDNLKINQEKIHLVANRYASSEIYSKSMIERILNKKIDAVIPFDFNSIVKSINSTTPITISKPNSELAKSYCTVAQIIDPTISTEFKQKKGFIFKNK